MKVKLGEIATYINGYAFKPSDWSDIGRPIIRIQDLTGNSYQMNRFNGICDSKYIVRNGDVLISWSASLGVYIWQGEEAILNQHIFKVVFNKVYVNKSFFVHQVRKILESASTEAHGATMKHLTKPVFDALPFYLPPIDEQKRIAYLLDKVCGIIEGRERQIQKMDELVKARFVEMFGEPESNPFGWEKVNMAAVVRGRASNGFFAKREEYVEDGNVAILGVAYVVNRMYSQVEGLPRTNASDANTRKYKVEYGDMLFCRSSLVAEGIGKASIVPEGTPENTLFECHVIRLPLDLGKCIPEYMQVLTATEYFRKQMIAQSKTATMTTIGQDGIMNATIILPPIEKQREFYSFVKRVVKSKLSIQASLDQLETLKQSLMQKYFG